MVPERRATAVGWFQFAVTGAPTIGLVAGGPLIDAAGWRVVFFAFAGSQPGGFRRWAPVLAADPSRGRAGSWTSRAQLALASGVLGVLLAITEVLRGPGRVAGHVRRRPLQSRSPLFVHIERTVDCADAEARLLPAPELHHAAAVRRGGAVRVHGGLCNHPGIAVPPIRVGNRGYCAAHDAPPRGVQPRVACGWLASSPDWVPLAGGIWRTIFMSASMVLFAFAAPTSGAVGITR